MKGCGPYLGLALICLLLVGPLVGPALYLNARGLVIPGTVTDRRESISVDYGRWSRRLELTVRYQPSDEPVPVLANIPVSSAIYDRLHIGAQVPVRTVPNRTLRQIPLLLTTRLDEQSTMAFLQAQLDETLFRVLVAIAGGLVLLVLWLSISARGIGWLLLIYLIGALLYFIVPTAVATPSGPLRLAQATVTQIHPITRAFNTSRSRGIDAVQPFNIVELTFVPVEQTEAVIAVDQVDAGSVPELENGGTVIVSYPADNPRAAIIDGATRTFYWKNTLSLVAAGGVLLLALLIMGFFGAIYSRFTVPLRANQPELRRRVEERRRGQDER